jgi:hypothetical protein
MMLIKKSDGGFDNLRAVCVPLTHKEVEKNDHAYAKIISVETFDVPGWGEPYFSVREGATVAVATNGRKQVVAEVPCLEAGQYRLMRLLKNEIMLERVETEVQFPNWRRLLAKTVKDGEVFTGDGELAGKAGEPLNKSWEVAGDPAYWIHAILYSIGKEGFCVDTTFIAELVSNVHFRKSVVVIAPCGGMNNVSLHFHGMAVLVAPLPVGKACRPFTGA